MVQHDSSNTLDVGLGVLGVVWRSLGVVLGFLGVSLGLVHGRAGGAVHAGCGATQEGLQAGKRDDNDGKGHLDHAKRVCGFFVSILMENMGCSLSKTYKRGSPGRFQS
jgi:hypothetical protein